MRILDTNSDFYDYLQNVYIDKSVTFDRTDSFVIEKQQLLDYLTSCKYMKVGSFCYMLLQVCHTFWLFILEVTEAEEFSLNDRYKIKGYEVKNYDLELLHNWKNYDLDRKLIDLSFIKLKIGSPQFRRSSEFPSYMERKSLTAKEIAHKKCDIIVDAVNHKNYEVDQDFNQDKVSVGSGKAEWRHIPILKKTGLANYIDHQEIFSALEEYFSLQKQDDERTESIGITDKEKIENHGFDTKVSFRGKPS